MNRLRMLLILTALITGGSAVASAQPYRGQEWGYGSYDSDRNRNQDRDRNQYFDRDERYKFADRDDQGRDRADRWKKDNDDRGRHESHDRR